MVRRFPLAAAMTAMGFGAGASLSRALLQCATCEMKTSMMIVAAIAWIAVIVVLLYRLLIRQ